MNSAFKKLSSSERSLSQQSVLKTLARFGRGIDLNGKCEEIEQFEVAPHPTCGHLLPDGEAEDLIDGESSAVENFQ